MIIARRKFITGLVSFVAAPAIVKAGSIMPIKMIKSDFYFDHENIKACIKELNSYRLIEYQYLAIQDAGKILIDIIPKIYNTEAKP